MFKSSTTIVIFLSLFSCATKYSVSTEKDFYIKPNAKFIVRLTDTDYVVDPISTNSTQQLLKEYNHQVMPTNDFDSINYRYFLHLNDSWDITPKELRNLHKQVDYDYLLVGGFSVLINNFYLYHTRTDYEKEMNLNLPEKSVVEFTYYLYSIRNQRLVLSISVRKTASGNAFTHVAFGTLILPKALKKLEKYLQ